MFRSFFLAPVAVCAGWLMLSLSGCVREHTLFDAASGGQAGAAVEAAGQMPGDSAGAAGPEQAGRSGSGPGVPAVGMSGTAGSKGEGGSAGTPSAWTQTSCVQALGQGKPGDACLEVFKCTATADCCETIASCDGKTLNIQNNCTLCPMKCSADSDCGAKALCENYQCRSCPTEPCPDAWSTVL
ncbi:MAG TPA: hypothetical protein VFK05_25420, partial [Polyangiaceae bacterium]|nr:hypothetical protein [Polyangiaceae bacterium]